MDISADTGSAEVTEGRINCVVVDQAIEVGNHNIAVDDLDSQDSDLVELDINIAADGH